MILGLQERLAQEVADIGTLVPVEQIINSNLYTNPLIVHNILLSELQNYISAHIQKSMGPMLKIV